MKIGIFLSIFSNDEISNSISYICKLCENIKRFNYIHTNHNNYNLIVNTDEFTYKIIKDICRQENINIDNVIFHKHRRNMGLRGMFWRFESFYNDEYDICINAEGDYSLEKYLKDIEFFEKNEYTLMLYNVRKIQLSRTPFAAGRIFIKPKLLEKEVKEYIKKYIELFDHIDDIDYGVDEYFLVHVIKKYFLNNKNIIIVSNKSNIKDHVDNLEEEVNVLQNIFKKSNIITINNLEELEKNFIKYTCNNDVCLKYYIKTFGDDLCYCLYNQCLRLKKPFRVAKSEFCQDKLIKFLE